MPKATPLTWNWQQLKKDLYHQGDQAPRRSQCVILLQMWTSGDRVVNATEASRWETTECGAQAKLHNSVKV